MVEMTKRIYLLHVICMEECNFNEKAGAKVTSKPNAVGESPEGIQVVQSCFCERGSFLEAFFFSFGAQMKNA
jgi:hypothetical protein